MFKTFDDGRAQLPSDLPSSNTFTWEYAIFDSSAPWLLVTARITESDGDSWTQNFFLKNYQQLQRLMEQHKVFLHRVQLVRPISQKSLGWEIDDVLGIWTTLTQPGAASVEDPQILIEYKILGGEICTYVNGKKSNANGKGLKQIYSILDD